MTKIPMKPFQHESKSAYKSGVCVNISKKIWVNGLDVYGSMGDFTYNAKIAERKYGINRMKKADIADISHFAVKYFLLLTLGIV